MNRQAKKTVESVLIVGLFALVFIAAFALAVGNMPDALFVAKDGTAQNGTNENASKDSAKFFNISLNWSQTAATTLTSNNISQVNISLPPNFTFGANQLNGTSAFDDVSFTNLSFSSGSDNISQVLSWSNFTGILVNASVNASFWFNATPSTAGWFNITVSFLNGTDTASYTVNYMNLSVFVNDTGGSENFINTTSGSSVQAGGNYSALKSGMNYSGNVSVRITGSVDYPEVLRIEITNGSTNGAVLTNYTGNQTTQGADADGYWYSRINTSVGSIANASNGSSMFYNFTVVVREATHNLTNFTVFTNIRFDDTKPIIQSANISAPFAGGNYSGNMSLNITGTDATGITGFWNVTNASATAAVAAEKQNATIEISGSSANIMTATFNTVGLGDGYYNFSFLANDTAGNNNNHSDTYAGAPKVTYVVIDNTAPAVTLTLDDAATGKNNLDFDIAVTDWPSNVSGTCTHDRGGLGTVSGGGAGTQVYTESGLNCGASTIVKITCVDYAGNSQTKSITATTDSCTGGSSSSGGGGGSGGGSKVSWTATYSEDNKELSEISGGAGLTRELGSKSRVKLKVSGETHYVGVTSLTDSSATIEVSSTPQSATLQVGEERKFDTDSDGSFYDLSVKLNSISDNKADVTIKAINEEITGQEVDEFASEDVNRDGLVNILDQSIVKQCLFMNVTGDCTNADVNGDGIINVIDQNLVKNALGGAVVPAKSPEEDIGGSKVGWIIAILVIIVAVVVFVVVKKNKSKK
jgi:hypothetical protein